MLGEMRGPDEDSRLVARREKCASDLAPDESRPSGHENLHTRMLNKCEAHGKAAHRALRHFECKNFRNTCCRKGCCWAACPSLSPREKGDVQPTLAKRDADHQPTCPPRTPQAEVQVEGARPSGCALSAWRLPASDDAHSQETEFRDAQGREGSVDQWPGGHRL